MEINRDHHRRHLTDRDKEILRGGAPIAPCPFCGDKKPTLSSEDGTAWLSCPDCGAEGPVKDNISKAEAAWNWRGFPRD